MVDETFLTELIAQRVAWKQSLSTEDVAKLAAENEAWTNNETKGLRIFEMLQTFTTADTNNNQVLNEAEFRNFWTMVIANSDAKGVPRPPDYTEDQ